MINDLLILFKNAYDKYGDKIILDSYRLKPGVYIKLNKDNKPKILIVTRNGLKNDEYRTNDLYSWFKERDYYSNIIETNKAIDTSEMKIHSNNYLTCFMKRKNLPDMISTSKIMKKVKPHITEKNEIFFEVIEQHFFKISNPREYNKNSPQVRILFDQLAKSLPIDNMHEKPVEEAKKIILYSVDEVVSTVNSLGVKEDTYIKMFIDFQVPIKEYIDAYEMYARPRIFNDNSYNIIRQSEIWGLSNNNMGVNSDKPYLKLMSTAFNVPFRINIDSAILCKKMFEWIACQEENELYIPTNYDLKSSLGNKEENRTFYYLYFTTNSKDGFRIEDFDYLPSFCHKLDIVLFNFLQLEEGETDNRYTVPDMRIRSLYELEDQFNGYFFNGRLKNSYYQEPKVKTNEFSKTLLDLLIISRKAMHDYFKKGIENNFKDIIDRVSIEAVKEQLKMAEGWSVMKTAKAMNLRLSLLKYFKLRGEDMGDRIQGIIGTMKERLEYDSCFLLQKDDEFYFLSGQLAYYLISQSEASKKTHGLVEPFLRSKNAQQLKRQLRYTYDRYKHAIPLSFFRFNNAMAAVQGYDTDTDLMTNQDMFLSGFMAKNIFYAKKEQGGNENEE